ncbi:hypothetical protein BU15DRAFT_67707 [Melanogaster broomeanus]|nr:hypothetical protein BU15DRAFT_67707 [Melanogaster broomeanus]
MTCMMDGAHTRCLIWIPRMDAVDGDMRWPFVRLGYLSDRRLFAVKVDGNYRRKNAELCMSRTAIIDRPRPAKDLQTIYLETERGAKAIESPTAVFDKGENNSSRSVAESSSPKQTLGEVTARQMMIYNFRSNLQARCSTTNEISKDFQQ